MSLQTESLNGLPLESMIILHALGYKDESPSRIAVYPGSYTTVSLKEYRAFAVLTPNRALTESAITLAAIMLPRSFQW